MDPQDNTFPIPQPQGPGAQNPVPVTPPDPLVGAPSADPASYAAAGTAPIPNQPIAPEWTANAAADAAGLEQPYAAPAVQPDPALAPPAPVGGPAAVDYSTQTNQPFAAPVYPATAVAPEVATGYEQPVAGIAPVGPAYASAPIPQENTLDLSGQAAVAQPEAYSSNVLQPGVDIQPGMAPVGTDQFGSQVPLTGAEPLGMPADFGTSYNNLSTSAVAMQTGKSKKPLKIIIIVVAILALLLIAGAAIIFTGRNQRKPAIELNQENITSPSTPSTDTATLPAGYKLVTRDCFSFGIIEQNTINFDLTRCSIEAKFGDASQYSVAVTPTTSAVADLNAYVNTAKAGTLVSENDITLGGIAAKKIVQTVNGQNQQLLLVIPTGKTYTFNNQPITGFSITSSYNDELSRTVSDTFVSTWSFK